MNWRNKNAMPEPRDIVNEQNKMARKISTILKILVGIFVGVRIIFCNLNMYSLAQNPN